MARVCLFAIAMVISLGLSSAGAQTQGCQFVFQVNAGFTTLTNGSAIQPNQTLFVGTFNSGRDIYFDGVFAERIFGWPNGVSTSSLSLGPHTVRAVHPVDLGGTCAGQFTEISFIITNDAVPPTISNLLIAGNPVNEGFAIVDYGLGLRVTASDDQTLTNLLAVRARFGGLSWFNLSYDFGSGQWQKSLDASLLDSVPNGTYALAVEVRDGSGNVSTLSRSVNVSLPAPSTPTITTPSAGQVLLSRDVIVNGTAVNASQVRVVSADNSVDDLSPVNVSGSFSSLIEFPADGSYTITATGQSANRASVASSPLTFRIDSVGPIASEWQFDDDSVLITGSTINRKGRVRVVLQDASAITGSTVSLTLAGATVNNGFWNQTLREYSADVDFDAVTNGNRTLQVFARDEWGNERTSSLTVNVAIPSLASPVFVSPSTANTYVRSPNLFVAGTARRNSQVQLLLNGSPNGSPLSVTSDSFSSQLTLPSDGVYQLQAVAITSRETSAPSSPISVTLDRVPPTIGAVSYAGVPLINGAVISSVGSLQVTASDAVALADFRVEIGGSAVLNEYRPNGILDIPVSFSNAANGAYRMTLLATDRAGNTTQQTIDFTLNLPAPSTPPLISFPANNAQVATPTTTVSGTAPIGTQVQLYLNGSAVSGLTSVTANGSFATFIGGLVEGSNAITAEATNIRGVSPRSSAVNVILAVAPPTLLFASPGNGATITSDTIVELIASANAPRSVASVVLSIDGTQVANLTSAPFRFNWDVANVANGSHTLSAVATDSGGTATTTTIQINLNKPPPPVITPYVGKVDSVTPSQSYGTTTVAVQGRALGRFNSVAVGGAPLLLKLNNNGFVRTLNVVTDASGSFTFNFIPQPTDSGAYQVSLIHPDENTTPTVQGNFSVDRLAVNNPRIRLRAARGFTERFTVNLSTSPGATASSVSLATPAAAQPSGTLPQGIGASATPTTVSAGAGAVPYEISFTSTAQSPANGVLVAQLFASESGSAPRAEIRIDFELVNAEPAIVPTPSVLSLGAKRGQGISERILLENNGLVAANAVTATLLTLSDTTPPAWVFLSSASSIGAIAAGSTSEVQINASPDTGVDDGVYQFKLRVRRDVAGTSTLVGDLPISIAVTSSDNGKVTFETADIYTNTRDTNNNLIQGVANTRISLTNEAVPTQVFNVTTDAQGVVQTPDIPAGRYRWRASASNHKDTSGIVVVRPGGNTQQKIFLEYTVVSFNFSVTETTIQDQYDIVITATFQTQVPAPVVIIEPSAINVPPMQVGEQISGEITITNYGLIRADNVVFTPPQSNEYWNIEIGGTVPPSLDAKQRIVLPYKLTLISATPIGSAPPPQIKLASGASLIQRAMANGVSAGLSRDPSLSSLKRATQKSGGGCSSIQTSGSLAYEFTCANGDKSGGSGGVTFATTYGSSCGGGGVGDGGGTSGGGGGWGGDFTGPGGPLSPGCTPDCPKGTCCGGGGGGPGN
jgi:hypothetical protein